MTKPYALIIEDDPKLGPIYMIALQQIGFDTDIDAFGNQFQEKLSAIAPAIILLDLHMPFASGVEILHQIRSDNRWVNIPVIVMTADIRLAKTINEPPERILIKPISVSHIQKIVLQLVNA